MKDSFRVAILFFVIAGILALALGGYLGFISERFNVLLTATQGWVSTRFVAIQEFILLPRQSATLIQRNAQLEAEVSRLQAQVVQYQQQVAQTEALAALVNFSRARSENSYTAASVIGRDPSPFLHYIILDRGSADGIQRGMPVITEKGLVGRVDAVIANAARVQLINDPGSSVNIRLEKAGREAALAGSVSGDLSLELVSQDVPVEIGDILLTSGLGGGFPPDLIVGQILNVRKRDSDLFQQATVQPVVDFAALKIVLIITDFRSVDISPLLPTP